MTGVQQIDSSVDAAMPAALLPTRFGPLPFQPGQIWTAETPLPGFESLQRFGLISLQTERPFVWLQSLDDAAVSFLLVQAAHFGLRFARLPADAMPLVMVLLPEQAGQALRAHRQAPLLFDAQTGTLSQLIVEAADVEGDGVFAPQVAVELPVGFSQRVLALG
ncbi:MAG: flagellar assembly protein FliW [Thiomonas sp.]|nr:flagellar assembly protein FliW [Thiomonas sp.]